MADLMEFQQSDTESEPMDTTDSSKPDASSSSSGTHASPPDSVVTKQPARTQHPDQTPPPQNQDQHVGPAGVGGADSGVLPAAQISSSVLENPSAAPERQHRHHSKTMSTEPDPHLYRSGDWPRQSATSDTPQDLYTSGEESVDPPAAAAAAADVTQTSSSACKSSDTGHKKRQIKPQRGNSVNELQDAAADNEEKNPSAPRDVRKVYVKVIWPEEIPPRWNSHLQMALQTWCNSESKEECSVTVAQLSDDQRTAEVEITPSHALKDIKTATLPFKKLNKSARVDFQDDAVEFVNNVSNPKGNENGSALTKAEKNPSEPINNAASEKIRASDELTLAVFQYWYLSQAHKQELDKIQNDFGVKINAEVSVSISAEKSDKKSESDSVSKATQAFSDLVKDATKNLQSVSFPQTHMESDIMKETLRNIPYGESKLMLSISPNNNLLFGPERFISMVAGRLNLEPGVDQGHDLSRTSMQLLDMDFRDTCDHIEMNETHWRLMAAAFYTQICEIQNKYGVQFNSEPVQGGIKVSARSTAAHQVNLEAHALRALTQIYQKAVTSAVTCDLKDASSTEIVSQAFKRIHSQHACVGGEQRNGSWKLFGLPKHLVSAIADIEKLVGCPVVDEKMKQSLGYQWDFPHAGGFQRGGMEMDVMRGAHGADWKDGVGSEKFGFNKDASKDGKENAEKKASDKSEDDTCPICLDTFTEKNKLKCGHEFCKVCLDRSIESGGKICPICKKIFGTLRGNQPDGKMDTYYSKQSLPGFPGFGTIEITYRIPSGKQTSEHPNPGKHYHATTRTAYLPDNHEGNQVLNLLRRAFDQRLIFTVGTSRTTGAEDAVTWNDIHHKTNIYGGPENFGYPDPDYLTRVKEELKAKGIE